MGVVVQPVWRMPEEGREDNAAASTGTKGSGGEKAARGCKGASGSRAWGPTGTCPTPRPRCSPHLCRPDAGAPADSRPDNDSHRDAPSGTTFHTPCAVVGSSHSRAAAFVTPLAAAPATPRPRATGDWLPDAGCDEYLKKKMGGGGRRGGLSGREGGAAPHNAPPSHEKRRRAIGSL